MEGLFSYVCMYVQRFSLSKLNLIVCNVGMFTRRNISARDKWRGISINTTHLNSLHQIAATQFVAYTVTRKSVSLNQHFCLWIVNPTLLEKEDLDLHFFYYWRRLYFMWFLDNKYEINFFPKKVDTLTLTFGQCG